MDWFCQHNGTTCDPRWITIAKHAKCAPGVVSNVWAALLEHGNRHRPRGTVGSFDAETYVDFSGFDADQVAAVLKQFDMRKLIVGGRIADSAKYYPEKTDRTAKDRKQRQRLREAEAKGLDKVTPRHGVTHDDNAGHAVTVTVTPQERQSEALALVGNASNALSSCSVGNSQSKSEKHARVLNEQEVMQELEQGGHAGSAMHRFMHQGAVARWVSSKITGEQLHQAIALGKAKRETAKSTQPLNIGFIDKILGDIFAGKAPGQSGTPRPSAGHSPQREEDPVANALAYARQMLEYGAIDPAEYEAKVADAMAKRVTTV